LLKISLQSSELSKYKLNDGLLSLYDCYELRPEFEVGSLHQETAISAKVLHMGQNDKEMGLLENVGVV
jgi:hypothetical protein